MQSHRIILLGLFLVAGPASAATPLVIDLWAGTAPDETGTIGPERVRMSPKLERRQVEVTEPSRMITGVTKPTITIYSPTKATNNGTAVLKISDITGKEVAERQLSITSNIDQVIDVRDLNNGTYDFSITFKSGERASFPVVIAR